MLYYRIVVFQRTHFNHLIIKIVKITRLYYKNRFRSVKKFPVLKKEINETRIRISFTYHIFQDALSLILRYCNDHD